MFWIWSVYLLQCMLGWCKSFTIDYTIMVKSNVLLLARTQPVQRVSLSGLNKRVEAEGVQATRSD